MDPNIQDWFPVIIKKSNTHTTNVTQPHIKKPPTSIKTIYDEDGQEEIPKLKTVSHEMAQFIIKSRVEKGLKQVDLAKKACLDTKLVAEIERGGCIYNAGQINKIAKALGVNIPRK